MWTGVVQHRSPLLILFPNRLQHTKGPVSDLGDGTQSRASGLLGAMERHEQLAVKSVSEEQLAGFEHSVWNKLSI